MKFTLQNVDAEELKRDDHGIFFRGGDIIEHEIYLNNSEYAVVVRFFTRAEFCPGDIERPNSLEIPALDIVLCDNLKHAKAVAACFGGIAPLNVL